jgi:maltose alpha-D-glucosyltransferase/alpha-amylase
VLLTGEQSNTSIRYGMDAVIKVFRKWQPGVNPDTEIVEYLTEHSAFDQVPAFLGGVRLDRKGTVTEVAAVQSFVENDGDSWKWLPPALVTLNDTELPGLLEAVGLLGQRTGELHAALAYGTGEAFVPEVLTSSDVAAIRRRISSEVAMTIRMLIEAGMISPGDGDVLQGTLLARIGEASSLVGSARTRVHGDYHLGQVLRSHDDFVIIDFEGEPSRSMAERREKHSPFKDVAGMLRSLDYAVATASQDVDHFRSASLREVGLRMEQAFLDGYAAGIADGPDWILPTEADAFRTALDLYMIEKAVYEVRYELDNRPGWIGIPVGALQRIAAT